MEDIGEMILQLRKQVESLFSIKYGKVVLVKGRLVPNMYGPVLLETLKNSPFDALFMDGAQSVYSVKYLNSPCL